ncbi:uncharacterized protein LOC123552830 [Mercenaria mercenaria]|uniref:uncharacterized protein LOC123552830 n=1 Tax=Mercenaria mercenaria TaxID=6596 RepID=UPI00234EF884|nr:uncharacterized protein LOC123552830 [Mercenaria mercenaria]
MFSVRIVSTDHYMCTPLRGLDVQYADQRCTEVKKVPVVRIFGSTPAGQKTCMHVHGVFPYLYVPYDGTVPWDRYLRQFATSLDKAINVAQGHGQANIQHVYKVVLVNGKSMYGYHDKEQQFLKIYFYNPSMIRKAADLLLGGAVLNKPFQPHESHIPYTLQLFIDYNLYGMNMINAAAVKFRRHTENVDHEVMPLSQGSDEGFGSDPKTPISFTGLLNRSGSMTPSQRVWQSENIPSELYLDDSVERLSTCELEVDVVAADILNRLDVGANIGTNPGLAALWEDERQRRQDRGESTDIAPPESQERVDIEVAESEMILRERLQQILLDLQPYMDSQSDTESEQSQDTDFPLTQASDLHLHVSQDDLEGSQDTVMFDADDLDEDKPVVDEQSIQRVVSFSQSFCDVRPEIPKVSSQDKSLVDILASLADDTSPPSSQNAAAEAVALEEQDSILSQLSQPRDKETDQQEEEEVLEMSQRIWEREDEKDDDDGDDDKFDLAGMDDTWIDSQIDSPDQAAEGGINDDLEVDSDSDATSDIIPQYDGPSDKKDESKRAEAKQAILKRLGMRGPTSNVPLPNRGGATQYDSSGNMMATNPFADAPSTSQNFNVYPGGHVPRFPASGSWNAGSQNWGRNVPAQTLGMHHSPGAVSSPTQHHSPVSYHQSQHSPSSGQYSPISSQPSGMPAYQMSPRNQNLHSQYTAGNQSFGQSSPQSQLSPGSYQNRYPASQSYNPAAGQQMSPPYTAQHLHHAQPISSQSNIPYSPPVTYTHSQNQRTHDMDRYMQASSERYQLSNENFSQKPDPSHLHDFKRANQMEAFHMPTYSRTSQVTPTQNPLMPMANQMAGLQSHDHKRPNQNPAQIPTDLYRINSNPSSHDSDIQNPYQQNNACMNSAQQNISSLPMYTAQPLNDIVTSQTPSGIEGFPGAEQSNPSFDAKRPNPALLSNQIVADLLEQGNRRGRGRGKNLSTHPLLQSTSRQHNLLTSPDSQNRNVKKSLSNALLQRRQKSGTSGEYPDPLTLQNDITNIRSDPFGRQMSYEGSGYTHMSDSSSKASQQLSPRTPSGDSSMQSPGSASSKQSEPFVGPITKYYNRKRLMYEQISPPATPSSTIANDINKKPQSVFSPSNNFSEQQISPLQRLLLDNSDLPPRSDQRQRTPSRSSMSSLSSVGSEKPQNHSQQDMFSSRHNQEKSRLFNLLSSVKNETESRKETKNVTGSVQQSLNDSQQDLFADSLLSDISGIENTTADSLSSLFSDDTPIKPAGQQEIGETGNDMANNGRVQAAHSKDDFASLSSLESFVGSVRNESTEFGVNFHKTSATELLNDASVSSKTVLHGTQQNMTLARSLPSNLQSVASMSGSQENVGTRMPAAGDQQNVGQRPMPGSQQTLERLPQSFQLNEGRGHPLQDSQGRGHPAYQSPGRSYNLTDWPQYPVQPGPKVGRGRGQRRRGRPPGKKGLNFPVETFGVVQKKRRGRPKKNGDSFTLPPSFQQRSNVQAHSHLQAPGSQFSQQLQNQYSMPPNTNAPPNIDPYKNIDMNMPYYPSQPNNQSQSFSQLLETDNNDLLAEFTTDSSMLGDGGSQFGNNIGIPQGGQTSDNQFVSETNFNSNIPSVGQQFALNQVPNPIQDNFPPSRSQSQNHQNLSVEGFKPSGQDRMSLGFQGHQYSCQKQEPNFQGQSLPTQQQLQTINLSEAMQISEPPMNFNTDLSDLSNEDLSQILPVIETGHTSAISLKVNEQFTEYGDSVSCVASTSHKMNMQAVMKKKNQQSRGNRMPADTASVMELIRYRQRSEMLPKASAAYKFKFKVPTPVFKRLKFRVKRNMGETESIDFVRMHPKDARKYSLLKIGREIIQLKKLSENMVDSIREKLKSGEDVEGIPPPIRLVEVSNIPPTGSIIADLLSADSPLSDDMIGTGGVEDMLNGSIPQNMIGNNDIFMIKKQKLTSKDKKPNSMFRGKNIANVPHLKKYRAGFPYFGKGHVGRGASHNTKLKANNKGLKPEYDDDENIVLKDVCLNDASDGILTPIKSRTPVAGRSPAHYGGGGNMPEMESQEKSILESKLEYDLDLNQSGNSQMFQDVLMGEKELQNKTEFENAEEDPGNKDDKERMKVAKTKVEKTENEICVKSNYKSGAGPLESYEIKAKETKLSKPEYTGKNAKAGSLEELDKSIDTETGHCNKSDLNDRCLTNMDIEYVNSVKRTDNAGAFNILKKQFEKHLGNGKNANKVDENVFLDKTEKQEGMKVGVRSRSSSRESQMIPSQTSSRRNSVILSGMSGDEEKCFWSAESIKRSQSSDGSDSYRSDSKRAKKSKSSAYGSSSAGSRKSSRSSSLDQDSVRRKSKSKKKQKKSYRYDSDSDGIPGVDYIVVNRFKGRKELRVVVEKLKVNSEAKTVFDQKKNGLNSVKSEHLPKADVKNEDNENKIVADIDPPKAKSVTGFSAEFEKFLASKSDPSFVKNESDSDTEDCDILDSGGIENYGDEPVIYRTGIRGSKGNKSDGTEYVIEKEPESSGKLEPEADLKDTECVDVSKDEMQREDVTEDVEITRPNGCSAKHGGMRDFSSSSDEEKRQKRPVRPNNDTRKQAKFEGKKKKVSKSIHDGSVFCSRARKKRPKPKSRSSKLMCSLSALHDATLEKLTSFPMFNDLDTGNSSSSQSPAKSRDVSDIDSPVRWHPRVKTPDFELYLDRTDDHVSQFEDTMYKLAYLSPMSSDGCCDSPPRPLSPKEMRKLDGTVEQSYEKIPEHSEKKMTMSDVLKTMQTESQHAQDSEMNNAKETPGTSIKIAVAKIEALTFNDIKSFCLSEKDNEEKNKEKRSDSPPPDLGPPVLESEKDEKPQEGSPPPMLSPNKDEHESDVETALTVGSNLSGLDGNGSAPPFLLPCRSPRVSMSPRYSSPRCARVSDGSEIGDYFSIPVERDSSSRAGRSPGACSSSGSINVIHSEEFSDISDENDSDNDIGMRKRNRIGKPKYTDSPTMPNLSPRFGSDCLKLSTQGNLEFDEKERKLRDIKMFEDRLKKTDQDKHCEQERHKPELKSLRKADENRNNIFELLSGRYTMPLNQMVDQTRITAEKNLYPVREKTVEVIMKERLKNGYSGELRDSSRTCNKNMFGNSEKLIFDSMLKTDVTKFSQNKNIFKDAASNFATQRNELRNGELDYFKHNSHSRNGELNRSLSQNDFVAQYQSFRNSKAYQNMSMDLNRAALERNSPSNGKHLVSPTNFFETLNINRPSSRQSDRGINSGDLFESCSEGSSRHSFPSFNRSLSDNGRSEYGIVRSNKLSNSIMRSVQNYASKGKSKLDLNITTLTDVPFLEFGGGEGKRKQNVKAHNQSGRASTAGQSSRSVHLGEGDSLGRNNGNRDHGKGQGYQTFDESNIQTGCHVITPLKAPPSLENILESANQHGLAAYRPTGAFYSNYGDVPEKPREGGGHVLKLPSMLVKDLEEFDSSSFLSTSSSSLSSSSSSVTGIKNWRTILCAKDSLLSSQTGSSDLLEKLDTEPALKYAITGDQSVIITPCILPPSKKTVEKWYKGRKAYKNLKNQARKVSKEEEDKEEIGEKSKEDIFSDSEKLNPPDAKQETDIEFTKVTAKRKTNIKDKNEQDTKVLLENLEKSKVDEDIISPAAELDELNRSRRLSDNQEDDASLLHSTPVLRRGSTELFEPECTPITGEKRPLGSQGDQGGEFVTPKRIRPLRRLSTNTESTLRRAILSSQVKQQFGTPALQRRDTSQIEGPSLKNSFGFKHSQQNLQDAKSLHEYQYLTVLSVEIHAETRGDLKPDPEVDGIKAIFYSIFNDVHPGKGTRNESGVFIVDQDSANEEAGDKSSTNQKAPTIRPSSPQPGPSRAPDVPRAGRSEVIASTSKVMDAGSEVRHLKKTLLQKSGVHGLTVTYVKDENELLQTFIDFVHRWNPDILVGYEIQMLSWGYILQRASFLSINLAQAISRVPSAKSSSHHSKEKDEYGADHMSEIHIAGRIVLNLWRLLRHEVTLNIYSFENIAFHVLHRRIPLFTFRNLTAWFKHRTHLHRWKVIEHYVTRAKANLEIMDQLDMVGRTSEFARVFGIEFYHVLSRGSQYRVESMMLRIAKPMNYIPVSPSVHQRARMKAPTCIPLTLEPESKFYTDPVVVVDFQSLYPSIMIAYNYCFSTCLGRVEWFEKAHEGPIEFGCTSLGLEPSVIKKLSDEVTISPNGVVFCKQSVKRGVLPIMVEEILKTRLMVKKAMSSYKGDKTLSRMLNARQLGLKLIANVTYGYTGANFSGRMPCIEVGDSIVRKARETLERSIKLIEDTPSWGARVVYGDTDSMFIELKGRSKDEAFKIGQDIARAVTAMFPKPIKLKFEKVYLPCVLQTKKRYVGFMYETPDQKEPVYDAKGIETVRRDTCSAVSKVLERSLKILFTTKDVSEVKSYIQQQCQKVMEGSVSLQDFIFAKEYRGMPGYKPGACVPALEIAKKQLRQDRRSEPRVGERVPYVIAYGSPGLPLIQLVRTPGEVLQDPSLRLNATYYITKQILPPLDRFLSLMGANVFSWYQEMPHSAGRVASHIAGPEQAKKGTISQYFATSNCPTCDRQTKKAVCERCMQDPQLVCMTLNDRITRWERVNQHIQQICGACVGTSDMASIKACSTLDCPVQYRRARASSDMIKAQSYRDILEKVFK